MGEGEEERKRKGRGGEKKRWANGETDLKMNKGSSVREEGNKRRK